MKGFKAVRRQSDDLQEEYSDLVAIDFTDSVDVTRQEHKDEQDVNVLMKRFGVTGQLPLRTNPEFTEIDYDHDLQTALNNIDQVKHAYDQLPPGVKHTYPTWQALLTGLERGDITFKGEQPDEPPKPPEPAPVEPPQQ